MLASYKVIRRVNLPDQVGLNTDKGVIMLNCETNECAVPGTLLASYKGSLYDDYDIDVVIHIDGFNDFTVVARRNASDYYDEDEEYGEDYYDEDDEIYYSSVLKEDTLLTALGEAFAAIERELSSRKKEYTKTEEKKSSKDDTPVDDFLRRLRNSLNSILNE